MQKIICTCCGQEISKADRFCPNCGENNELYVENQSVQNNTQKVFIKQPINKVQITPQRQFNNNAQKTMPQTNVNVNQKSNYVINVSKPNNASKIYESFKIVSGEYRASFYENNHTEMSWHKEYLCYKKTCFISGLIFFTSFIIFVIPLILLMFEKYVFEFLGWTYFIIVGIIGFISMVVYLIASSSLNSLMYDYIIYDLKRSGAKITYENKSTGTISYIRGGSKNQLSVYRGYNSHANSRYWH